MLLSQAQLESRPLPHGWTTKLSGADRCLEAKQNRHCWCPLNLTQFTGPENVKGTGSSLPSTPQNLETDLSVETQLCHPPGLHHLMLYHPPTSGLYHLL